MLIPFSKIFNIQYISYGILAGLHCLEKQTNNTPDCHQCATITVMTLNSSCLSISAEVIQINHRRSLAVCRSCVFLDQVENQMFGQLVPSIKRVNICKWPPQEHRLTLTCSTTILCTSSNTQVCENYDYTLALKIKRYPIFSTYTHIDSVL